MIKRDKTLYINNKERQAIEMELRIKGTV